VPLPEPVIQFLNESAESNGSPPPTAGDDLFKSGALDSFTLVEFIALLEEQCSIKVPDADVGQTNFQTIEAIERYVALHRS
jgi:acyl carrier protein